jgi:hypothetical protein
LLAAEILAGNASGTVRTDLNYFFLQSLSSAMPPSFFPNGAVHVQLLSLLQDQA